MSALSTIAKVFSNALPLVQTGLALFSTVKGYQAASAIEDEAKFNIRVFDAEREAAWRAYNDEASILRHEQDMFMSTQVAAYGKSGVMMAGSPMEVLADMTYRQQLDQTALYNRADVEQKKLQRQAHLAEWQAYQQASAVRTKSLANLGVTLMDANYRYGSMWSSSDREKVEKAAASSPKRAPAPRYTKQQANAVPGARGWRPVRGFT